jgi:hypothetical protein
MEIKVFGKTINAINEFVKPNRLKNPFRREVSVKHLPQNQFADIPAKAMRVCGLSALRTIACA